MMSLTLLPWYHFLNQQAIQERLKVSISKKPNEPSFTSEFPEQITAVKSLIAQPRVSKSGTALSPLLLTSPPKNGVSALDISSGVELKYLGGKDLGLPSVEGPSKEKKAPPTKPRTSAGKRGKNVLMKDARYLYIRSSIN